MKGFTAFVLISLLVCGFVAYGADPAGKAPQEPQVLQEESKDSERNPGGFTVSGANAEVSLNATS